MCVFGVRRSGAALACARHHSTANRVVSPAKRFRATKIVGDGRPDRCATSALQIRGQELCVFLECGGPAPLWPVLVITQLRIELCRRLSDLGPRRSSATAGQTAARPAHSKLEARSYVCFWSAAVRRRFGLCSSSLNCESSCVAG